MQILILQAPLWILIALMYWHMRSLRGRKRRSPFNENFLRIPGFSLRVTQRNMMFDLVLHTAGVFVTPYIVYSLLTGHQIVDSVIVIAGLAITNGLLVKSIRLFKRSIQFNLGLEAETATGQELNLLMRDGAWVFHDIPYQYGNIDHVIIASGGIFAIETKGISKPIDEHRSGQENATLSVEGDFLILPHGRTKAPIDQAKVHAKWLRQEIQRRFSSSVPVRAVVAVPGWRVEGSYRSECWVVNPKRGNSLRATLIYSSNHS